MSWIGTQAWSEFRWDPSQKSQPPLFPKLISLFEPTALSMLPWFGLRPASLLARGWAQQPSIPAHRLSMLQKSHFTDGQQDLPVRWRCGDVCPAPSSARRLSSPVLHWLHWVPHTQTQTPTVSGGTHFFPACKSNPVVWLRQLACSFIQLR